MEFPALLPKTKFQQQQQEEEEEEERWVAAVAPLRALINSPQDVGSAILHLLEGIPRSEHPAVLGLLLCALPTDSMLEILSHLLSKVGNLRKQPSTKSIHFSRNIWEPSF